MSYYIRFRVTNVTILHSPLDLDCPTAASTCPAAGRSSRHPGHPNAAVHLPRGVARLVTGRDVTWTTDSHGVGWNVERLDVKIAIEKRKGSIRCSKKNMFFLGDTANVHACSFISDALPKSNVQGVSAWCFILDAHPIERH